MAIEGDESQERNAGTPEPMEDLLEQQLPSTDPGPVRARAFTRPRAQPAVDGQLLFNRDLKTGGSEMAAIQVGAMDSYTAARKTVCPKLVTADKIFTWIEAVEKFVRVNMTDKDKSTQLDWCLLAQQSIPFETNDPFLDEMRSALDRYPLPTDLVEVKLWRPQELDEYEPDVAQAVVLRLTKVSEEGKGGPGRVYQKVSRPTMVWEWLLNFVEDVWLDEFRKDHYASLLDCLMFTLPARSSSLATVYLTLAKHSQKVGEYFRLGGIDDLATQKRAYRKTFAGDGDLMEEATKRGTMEEMEARVKAKLTSMYHCLC